MNPGTINNNERTGDRDLSFSKVLRPIRGCAMCDFDPYPICDDCQHVIAYWEVKRWMPPTMKDLLKNTKYTRIAASIWKVPAYFIYNEAETKRERCESCGRPEIAETKRLTVYAMKQENILTGFDHWVFTPEEFQHWVETNLKAKHRCTPEQIERYKNI